MAFAPSASWNSRSITHLANYPSPSLPMIFSDESCLLVPIGLDTVVRVDFGTPGVVSHVRPMILVKTGSGLEQFLVDVQNEPMFKRVEGKGTPWNGKQLVAHAQ